MNRLILFLLLASKCFGATWYVNKAATGANNGTSPANAWTSPTLINYVVLNNGDTVLVMGGNYSTEELSAYYPGKSNITYLIDPASTQIATFKAIQFYAANGAIIDGRMNGVNGTYWFKTVGLADEGGGVLSASVLARESDVFALYGVEMTQAAVTPDGGEHNGFQAKGAAKHGTVRYCYLHDIITDGIQLNNSSGQPTGSTYDWWTIDNLIIDGVGDDGIQDVYGHSTVSNVFVNRGTGPLFLGSHPDGYQLNPDAGHVRIYNSTFIGFNQTIFIEFCDGAGNIEIYNNKLIAVWPDPTALNTSRALNFSTRGTYSGTFLFANNVCYNFRSFFALNGGIGGGTPLFRNTIYLDCKQVGSDSTVAGYLNSSNLFYSTPGLQYYDNTGAPVSTPGNQLYGSSSVGNPNLANAATYDFRLTAGSAAIGIGTTLSSYFTTDFSGTTLTVPWDAGAYKYIAATQPVRVRTPRGVNRGPAGFSRR